MSSPLCRALKTLRALSRTLTPGISHFIFATRPIAGRPRVIGTELASQAREKIFAPPLPSEILIERFLKPNHDHAICAN